jgi:hypothetical protein
VTLAEAKLARLKAWEACCSAMAAYGKACEVVARLEGPPTPRAATAPYLAPVQAPPEATGLRALTRRASSTLPRPTFPTQLDVRQIPHIGAKVERLNASGVHALEKGLVVGIYGSDAEVEWSSGHVERWPLDSLAVVA